MRCVILTANGPSFSAGGDTREVKRQAAPAATEMAIRQDYRRGVQRLPLALFDLEVPVIAAVNGHAIGARGLQPLVRLVSYAHAGVDPQVMGLGPVPAARMALKRAGLAVADLDVIESNEAFAAQACAVTRLLELDPAKVNPNGSGISLGHPVGATGAIIATKALHELQRIAAATRL